MREFNVKDNGYITLRKLKYKDVTVPKGFVFDGVTVKSPFTFIFSSEDLTAGIKASCFHDYMCKNKSQYSMCYATNILVELWRKDGLSPIKSFIVKLCVNLYQITKGGWASII